MTSWTIACQASFSRGSSWPRDRTQVSGITGGFFTAWGTRDALVHYSHVYPADNDLFRFSVLIFYGLINNTECPSIANKAEDKFLTVASGPLMTWPLPTCQTSSLTTLLTIKLYPNVQMSLMPPYFQPLYLCASCFCDLPYTLSPSLVKEGLLWLIQVKFPFCLFLAPISFYNHCSTPVFH